MINVSVTLEVFLSPFVPHLYLQCHIYHIINVCVLNLMPYIRVKDYIWLMYDLNFILTIKP